MGEKFQLKKKHHTAAAAAGANGGNRPANTVVQPMTPERVHTRGDFNKLTAADQAKVSRETRRRLGV